MRISFLNKEVEKEVTSSVELYIAWRLLYDKYDDDIEPVHNKDWRKTQEKKEEDNLATLKVNIHKLKEELAKKKK